MGICTSVRSDKKRRNRDVTANQLPNKNNTFVKIMKLHQQDL